MWITLHVDDVYGKLTAPEVEAIQTTVLGPNQTDPIADAIINVTQEVRGYVAAKAHNCPLGSGLTIPSELSDAALSMVVVRAAARLPTKILSTDERVRLNTEALQLMRMVALGQFAVARPSPDQLDTVEDMGDLYPSYSVNERTRQFRDQTGV